ncbi:MAG TPA: hypothetical protein VFK85_01365 [Anaeromyxobacteraceae bacterium]|nr:hypothetical protein [Anaeromyxobacteraceae bacterium]
MADAAVGGALSFGPADVLARVARHGDLFRAPPQQLPHDAAASVLR